MSMNLEICTQSFSKENILVSGSNFFEKIRGSSIKSQYIANTNHTAISYTV